MLSRINREHGSDFIIDNWEHKAFYDVDHGRIEMHIRSLFEQSVQINGSSISFEKDETILTEYSYKYSIDDFKNLISDTYRLERVWTDKENKFGILYFEAN